MISQTVVIRNKTGIHARPASVFVKQCAKFQSSILLRHGDSEINGKSIISVLSGGLSQGTEVTLVIDGADETLAMDTLVALINSGFGEET